MSSLIPANFKPFPFGEGFLATAGPFYYDAGPGADGTRFGFISEAKHGNPNGVIHGGVLVTFADTFMGSAVYYKRGRCATISLNSEFVTGIEPGKWIEGKAKITKLTTSLAFVRGTVSCEGQTLLTASGIWKLFKKPLDGRPDHGPDV